MANFNQSPLGQSSFTAQAIAFDLGSDTSLAGVSTNTTSVISAGPGMEDIDIVPPVLRDQAALMVLPHYRRMERLIGAPAT